MPDTLCAHSYGKCSCRVATPPLVYHCTEAMKSAMNRYFAENWGKLHDLLGDGRKGPLPTLFDELGFLSDFPKKFTGKSGSEEPNWTFASHYPGEQRMYWINGSLWHKVNKAVVGAWECAEAAISALQVISYMVEAGFQPSSSESSAPVPPPHPMFTPPPTRDQKLAKEKKEFNKSILFKTSRVYALVSEMHRFLALIPAIMKEDDGLEARKVKAFGSSEKAWQDHCARNEFYRREFPVRPFVNREPEFQQTWEKQLADRGHGTATDAPDGDSSDDEDGGAPFTIRLDEKV